MVESRNYLGIYLRPTRATVACLARQGRDRKLLDSFSVSIEGEEDQSVQLLIDRVVQACRTRKVKYSEAAVALDGESFMQHRVHSEFTEPRRIAATIRFDTEETLAADVSDVAVSFRVLSTDETGSQLDVFTAQRAVLSDIILSLQSNGIDPVAVDPDVYCLSRYLTEYAGSDASEGGTLYAVLSDTRGYLVVVPGEPDAPTILRTFLIGSTQDRAALLARETMMTTALVESAHPVGRLCVLDTAGEVAPESVADRTGLEVTACDLTGLAGVEAAEVPDAANTADFALAYGAASGLPDKVDSVNLRNDHMPYLGKRMRVQKAVRFLSIAMTILLLAVGVFFHTQLLQVNKDRAAIRQKLEYDYHTVMLGEKDFPATMRSAVNKLESALRILRRNKTGQGGDRESIHARLEMVLLAVNRCAKQTDLNIDSVTITPTSIVINGDTASRQATVDGVHKAMNDVGLAIRGNSGETEGGRHNFTITVEPERRAKGA